MKIKTGPIYFENLNAIRTVAFLFVFLRHFCGYIELHNPSLFEKKIIDNLAMNGCLGVNLFFVLSGFLITYLLIDEKEESGKINVRYFYIRRVLRIWPLYYLILVICFVFFPVISSKFSLQDIKNHITYYLFFLNNFDILKTGFVGGNNASLGILWSIAVEEQFYLLWPLLLLFVNKKRYNLLFFAVIFISLLFRYSNQNNKEIIYFHTLSVMSDLAVGSLLAYHSFYKTKLFYAIVHMKKNIIILLYVVLISSVFFFQDWSVFNSTAIVTNRLILSVLFAFFIGEQTFGKNSVFKLGKFKHLSNAGIFSYGMYCTHLLIISLIQKMNSVLQVNNLPSSIFYLELFISLTLCIIVSYITFNYFEKKVLHYKNKFSFQSK